MQRYTQDHDHQFASRGNIQRCECGYTKMSQEIYTKRRKAWNTYYTNVWNTRARKRFSKILQLWKQGRMADVQVWSDKATEQLKKNDWDLETPRFEDPQALDMQFKLKVF